MSNSLNKYKVCSHCKKLKSVNNYNDINAHKLVCKECERQKERELKIKAQEQEKQERAKRKKKQCIICKEHKTKAEFTNLKDIPNEICKECMKTRNKYKYKQLVKVEILKEKIKRKNQYRRKYNYDEKYREDMKRQNILFRERYPEKVAAWKAISRFPKPKGCQLHHWSYNELHYTDIIVMKTEDHYKIHQYIEYDQETKMYRDKKSKFLLNTKSLHAAFISLILETY